MRTLLAVALALSVVVVSGCRSSCGTDVCYTPPARISTGYCGPVEPLAPLPRGLVPTSYNAPEPLPEPIPVQSSFPAPVPFVPTTPPNFCPPNQICGA